MTRKEALLTIGKPWIEATNVASVSPGCIPKDGFSGIAVTTNDNEDAPVYSCPLGHQELRTLLKGLEDDGVFKGRGVEIFLIPDEASLVEAQAPEPALA